LSFFFFSPDHRSHAPVLGLLSSVGVCNPEVTCLTLSLPKSQLCDS
jgi:hypothetical protein